MQYLICSVTEITVCVNSTKFLRMVLTSERRCRRRVCIIFYYIVYVSRFFTVERA